MTRFRCGHDKTPANTKVLKRTGGPAETCLTCHRATQNRSRRKRYRRDMAALGRTAIRAWGCGDSVIIQRMKEAMEAVSKSTGLDEARALARAALIAVAQIEARRAGE